MNWDAIGAIGEVLGAIGVIVSILYLAIQVRHNTRATQASASFDAALSWAASNDNWLNLRPEIKEITEKTYDPKYGWEDFSSAERHDVCIAHRGLFEKLEGQYFLYKHGFLDEGIWIKRRSWAASLISLPFYKEWWEQEKQQFMHSDEFIKAIESSPTIEMVLVGTKDKATNRDAL